MPRQPARTNREFYLALPFGLHGMYAPGSTPLTGFQTGFVAAPDGATKPYVLIEGGPASVVVVPGVADGLLTCVDVAAYLAWFYRERSRNCRLLILSRRQQIPANFGVEKHAEDMLHTVAHLDWGQAVWECISAAGPIGQWAAVKRPDLVAGLVLSSTFDHVTGRTRKVLGQWLEIVESAGAAFFWDMIEPKYRPPPEVLAQLDPTTLPDVTKLRDSSRLKCLLRELLEIDQRDVAKRITCPTLVIGGEDDRFVSPQSQREMARRIPNGHLEICAGFGHSNDMDNPEYQAHVERHLEVIARRRAERF